jgi:hypothetical protein
MPQQASSKVYLNFAGGLITQANPMVYPENTCKDIDNIDLERQGQIKRRLGLEFESGAYSSSSEWTEEQLSTYAVSKFEWRSVNGTGTINFLVVQVGGDLLFYNLGNDIISNSPIGKISLYTVRTAEDYYLYPFDCASGKGKLFVVGRKISPVYIQYDEGTNTFTGAKITIKIRDFEGIDESVDSPDLFGDDITPDPTPYVDQVNQDILDALAAIDLSQLYVSVGTVL